MYQILPITTIYLIAVSTIVIAGLLKKVTEWSFLRIATSSLYNPEDPTIKETFIKETFIKESFIDPRASVLSMVL